jgi:hypothetical protein
VHLFSNWFAEKALIEVCKQAKIGSRGPDQKKAEKHNRVLHVFAKDFACGGE